MSDDAAQVAEDDSSPMEGADLLAIHEAGHAVVALALGLRIVAVSITDATGTADFAPLRPKVIHGKPTTRLLRALDIYGQICLAGPTAELWSDPNAFNLEDYDWPDTGGDVEPWAQDVTEVMRLSAKLGTPDWFRAMARKTRERVEQHWSAIETVADALLRQGTLAEDELLTLVGDELGVKRKNGPLGRRAPSPHRGEGRGEGVTA